MAAKRLRDAVADAAGTADHQNLRAAEIAFVHRMPSLFEPCTLRGRWPAALSIVQRDAMTPRDDRTSFRSLSSLMRMFRSSRSALRQFVTLSGCVSFTTSARSRPQQSPPTFLMNLSDLIIYLT